ncbi:MAG: PAS domain S-box protein [Candidatus Acidiferrales bacterium]|jgi:two-component system NtrC family sensor kinase
MVKASSEHSSSALERQGKPPADSPAGTNASSHFDRFERRHFELWGITFFLLFVLTIVFAWVSWGTIRSLPSRYEALPIGLVVLVGLFGAYAWRRAQELSELRGLIRGLEQREARPPSDQQLDQLFGMIQRSQQGYRDLIDAFDDILFAIDLQGQIRAANRSFADLLGAPFQQVIGAHLDDFIEDSGGEGRRRVEAALPQVIERRRWAGTVQIHFKGQSSVRYFDCVLHAMVRGDRVQGFTVLGRDVTQQRENEARFTQLFESLQEGIYITSPEGQILDANPALVRLLGFSSKQELLASNMSDFFLDPGQIARGCQTSLDQPLTVREVILRRKDGAPVHCLDTGIVVRDAYGKTIRYQGALLDVTEQREVERRLHQQQEFARRLVGCFPDMILALDSSGRFTFVSPSVTQNLGYEAGEHFSSDVAAAIHEEDFKQLKEAFLGMVQGRQNFAALELRIRHRNGEWRVVRAHMSPLEDERGAIEGVVASGRDVTDLKRLETQLIQSEKLAAMGQMLAGVAHELNNPLTAILGVSELLRDREGLDDATHRQLDLAYRQARRAARIVQNLLDFSRPATTQKKLLDVSSIVERALQLHEHSLLRRNITVEFHPEPGLPAILGDANQLVQVFLNLIVNAEQAIREVRESGRIQVRLSVSSGRVVAVVQDDGAGIRTDDLPKIFDPFFTTKRPGGGTGLGLSISASIVRELGGSIEVESLPAGGSAFTVSLPVAAGDNSSASPLETGVHRIGALQRIAETLKGRSVLVVDDEEGIRLLLQEGLAAQGVLVDSVSSASEALALARHKTYDVVLCDLHLSAGSQGPSGDALAKTIRESAHSRPPFVILMTGDLPDSAGQAASSPSIRRIQKPFHISEVLSLMVDCFAASAESPRS